MRTCPLQSRAALMAILAGLALLAAVPQAGAKAPRDFVGLSSEDVFGGSAAYRAAQLPRQRAAGVGLLRQNFDWSGIERSPGRYDFGFYDASVAAAARHGIRILPVLYKPPSFRSSAPATGAQVGVYPPRRNEDMGSFAAVLVRRYGRSGSYWRANPRVPKLPIVSWQVWNEPNVPVYWRPRPSVRRYTALLRVVSRAIKSVDRRAEVVTAGLAPTKLQGSVRLERFIRGMYRAGGKKGFDTLALNAYARNAREFSVQVRGIRKLMRRHKDGRAKLWVTELGWANGGPAHRFNVGTAGQATRISSTLRWIARNRTKMRLRGLVYFQWRDQKPYPPAFKEMWGLHTGLVDLQGRPKPALEVFKRGAARFR